MVSDKEKQDMVDGIRTHILKEQLGGLYNAYVGIPEEKTLRELFEEEGFIYRDVEEPDRFTVLMFFEDTGRWYSQCLHYFSMYIIEKRMLMKDLVKEVKQVMTHSNSKYARENNLGG